MGISNSAVACDDGANKGCIQLFRVPPCHEFRVDRQRHSTNHEFASSFMCGGETDVTLFCKERSCSFPHQQQRGRRPRRMPSLFHLRRRLQRHARKRQEAEVRASKRRASRAAASARRRPQLKTKHLLRQQPKSNLRSCSAAQKPRLRL